MTKSNRLSISAIGPLGRRLLAAQAAGLLAEMDRLRPQPALCEACGDPIADEWTIRAS